MKLRWLVVGGTAATILGLTGGLIGVGVENTNKPSQISRLSDQINDTIYPPIPLESRSLPRTGPSLPSPGYEN
ncbi:MAG TPA: hypothetical protein H9923_02000 [Candidatus Dwaynia gallinarum]|nr:hypothetical protein [Candidatus Dwaynia gallinarum]